MCGRYVSCSTPQAIADHFAAVFDPDVTEHAPSPSWNVAPTNRVMAVVGARAGEGHGSPHVHSMHWGLVPHWAKDTKGASRMINARAETIAEKPSFKGLLTSRRCVVPMNGFYEWRTDDTGAKPVKTPHYIHAADDDLLAAAGLWTVWRDPSADADVEYTSVTIITTGANRLLSTIHDRMPVLLTRAECDTWLDTSCRDVTTLVDLLDPAPDDALVMHTVSREVNSVRNRGPHLIDPVEVVEGIGKPGSSGYLWSTDEA